MGGDVSVFKNVLSHLHLAISNGRINLISCLITIYLKRSVARGLSLLDISRVGLTWGQVRDKHGRVINLCFYVF